MPVRSSLALVLAMTSAACAQRPQGPAAASPQPEFQRNAVNVEVVATGLVNPWGIAINDEDFNLPYDLMVSHDGRCTEVLGYAEYQPDDKNENNPRITTFKPVGNGPFGPD